MNPRGYFATFLVLAAKTGLPFGLLWSLLFAYSTRTSFGEAFWPLGFGGGVAFGLLFGGVMALNFRAITVTVPVGPDRDAFLSRVTLHLAEIGYHPEQPIGNAYTFRPSLYAARAAGRITILVERPCSAASILGPVVHVRKLLKLLANDPCPAQLVYRQ